MRRFKNFSVAMIVLIWLPIIGVISNNILHDPFEIYFKDDLHPFLAAKEQQYAVAGIINNYTPENIIVGNSLTQNIIPSEVERVMGWKNVYSLAVNGTLIREISAVTDAALRKHEIRNVIFPLRLDTLMDFGRGYKLPRLEMDFVSLYDRNPFNDFWLYAHKNPQQRARDKKEEQRLFILRKFGDGLSRDEIFTASKDLFPTWLEAAAKRFNRPLALGSVYRGRFAPVSMTQKNVNNVIYHLEHEVEPLLKKYPGTNFYFVIPPMSFVKAQRYKAVFPATLEMVVERLSRFNNARIYSFLHNDFNGDLRLFMDYDHTHIEISRYIIQALANNRDVVTTDNLRGYTTNLARILGGYKVPDIWSTELLDKKDEPYKDIPGCLTYYDAARLVWGEAFSKTLYDSIPRSPYLVETLYLEGPVMTSPPLNATRKRLEQGCLAGG